MINLFLSIKLITFLILIYLAKRYFKQESKRVKSNIFLINKVVLKNTINIILTFILPQYTKL